MIFLLFGYLFFLSSRSKSGGFFHKAFIWAYLLAFVVYLGYFFFPGRKSVAFVGLLLLMVISLGAHLSKSAKDKSS